MSPRQIAAVVATVTFWAMLLGPAACVNPPGVAQQAGPDPLDRSNFENQWQKFFQEATTQYGLSEAQVKTGTAALQNCLARAETQRRRYDETSQNAEKAKDPAAKEKAQADLKAALEKLRDEFLQRVDSIASIEQIQKAAKAGFQSPARLNPTPRPDVGFQAPPFALKAPDGRMVSLEGLRGKVVVLHFWASWCGYSKKSLPEMAKVYEAVKDKPGVVVYGVNCRQKPDGPDPIAMAKENGCLYAQLLKGDDVSNAYDVKGFPTLFAVGPDGKVIFKERGFKVEVAPRLVPVIDEALKAPAKPSKTK
jgi:thiol-disulfide isomerase/thioredoxin